MICLRLFAHCERAAARRTFHIAGTSNAIRIAMTAITTKSSTNVKARRAEGEAVMVLLQCEERGSHSEHSVKT